MMLMIVSGIRRMQDCDEMGKEGGFLDVPSLITLKHPTLFIFSCVNAHDSVVGPKPAKNVSASREILTGNDGDSLESTQNTKRPKCCQIAEVDSHCDVTEKKEHNRTKANIDSSKKDLFFFSSQK